MPMRGDRASEFRFCRCWLFTRFLLLGSRRLFCFFMVGPGEGT